MNESPAASCAEGLNAWTGTAQEAAGSADVPDTAGGEHGGLLLQHRSSLQSLLETSDLYRIGPVLGQLRGTQLWQEQVILLRKVCLPSTRRKPVFPSHLSMTQLWQEQVILLRKGGLPSTRPNLISQWQLRVTWHEQEHVIRLPNVHLFRNCWKFLIYIA